MTVRRFTFSVDEDRHRAIVQWLGGLPHKSRVIVSALEAYEGQETRLGRIEMLLREIQTSLEQGVAAAQPKTMAVFPPLKKEDRHLAAALEAMG